MFVTAALKTLHRQAIWASRVLAATGPEAAGTFSFREALALSLKYLMAAIFSDEHLDRRASCFALVRSQTAFSFGRTLTSNKAACLSYRLLHKTTPLAL